MKETHLHREMLDYYHRLGYWARKWPDQVGSAMMEAGSGKLRFSLPKPFDLVLCSAEGVFGAVECKLIRGPTRKLDERTRRQVDTLLALPKPAWIALVINFRYTRQRTGRVNRVFVLDRSALQVLPTSDLAVPIVLAPEGLENVVLELKRIPGGWA